MRKLPPGRTARLWLRDRLDVASRAVDVLEEKTHALTREQRRLRQHVEDTGESWTEALRKADRWFVRAQVVGQAPQMKLVGAVLEKSADVRIGWKSLMGVTFPAKVDLTTPETRVGSVARSSALAVAADAYRRAAKLALDHAAATRALELVEAELGLTKRRLRGLEKQWLPRLRESLRRVELALAEEEREEMVRSRWIARGEADERRGGGPGRDEE